VNVTNIPTWENYVAAYQREGIIVIPNHGSPSNPKFPGYEEWQDPTWAKSIPLENLLFEIHETNKASALLGYNTVDPSKPIFAADVDLVKCLCPNTLHVKNSDHGVECVALARDWRKKHIQDFQALETELSFTPHGGCHFWAKASNAAKVSDWLNPILQRIDSRIFIEEVKGRGRQVLLPPSKIPDGTYVLMDNKGKRHLAEFYRIRELA
jgi:hypothetical protein